MYIDESGNSDIGKSISEGNRFLCLTGVIFDLDYLNKTFAIEFENFKTKYFGYNADNPVILHRKDIMNYRGRFSVLKNPNIKEEYNIELIENLKKWDYCVISVLMDKKEIFDMYKDWAKHPYHYCLEVLLEKYYTFLKDRDGIGDVMIESRDKEDDKKLSIVYRNMFKNGTGFVEGERLRERLTSVEIKIKPKSANIPGLQIADLLVTNLRNRMLCKYELRTNQPNSFGNKLTDAIIPKIFKHNKKYWGYGLKKLP